MNLKDQANSYETPKTLNIADLPMVDMHTVDVQEKKASDTNGEEFTYFYITVDGKDYRVPNSVMTGIKGLLTKMPNINQITVVKTGEGMKTRYNVVPYQGAVQEEAIQ